MTSQTDKSLKVGLVFDDSLDRVDGVSQYVRVVGAWLTKEGHQVTYLVGETKLKEWGGAPVISLAKNAKIKFNGNRMTIPLPAAKKRIVAALANDFDVLHIQVPYSPFMAQKLINRFKKTGAVIGTFHVLPVNNFVWHASKLLRIMYGKSAKRFDAMLSNSTGSAEYATKVFKFERSIVPLAFELDTFRNPQKPIAWPNQRDKKRIVFLGRLVERKGCEHIIRAFSILNSKQPNTELYIASDGPLRSQLESLVDELNLRHAVTFLGFIEEKDKPGLYATADIACFPSTSGESFGIVLLEAMGAGSKVVLAGRNPGYGSVLESKQELLFDPRDHASLASKLETYLTDEKLINQTSKWQQEYVEQFDIKVVGPHLVAIYEAELAKRRMLSDN